jgi:hypothetical protein
MLTKMKPKSCAEHSMIPMEYDSGTGKLTSAAKEKQIVTLGMIDAPVSIIITASMKTFPVGSPNAERPRATTEDMQTVM